MVLTKLNIIQFLGWMITILVLSGVWLIIYSIYGQIRQNDCRVIGYKCDDITNVYLGVQLFENVKYIKVFISVHPDNNTTNCDILKYMYPFNFTLTCNYYDYSRHNFSFYDLFNYNILCPIVILMAVILGCICHMITCHI